MMSTIPQPPDLQAGRDAGYNGGSPVPPPEIVDRAAYAQGHAEGRDEAEQELRRWHRARITTPPPSGAGGPSGTGPG